MEARAKQEAQKAPGSRLFFGQEKWEFMLTLMLGLQIAVEESKKTLDPVVHWRLSRSWSEAGAGGPAGEPSGDRPRVSRDGLRETERLRETEPILEQTYRIPSAWDSRQADNAKKCSGLVRFYT